MSHVRKRAVVRAWLSCAAFLFLASRLVGCGSDSENSQTKPHPDAGDAGGKAGDSSADSKVDGAGGSAGATDAGSDVNCPSGTIACGAQCVPDTDPAYGCGDGSCSPCVVAGATAACSNGACVVATCNTDFSDCNANPSDGCETNLKTDTQNCGTCANACVTPHATASCKDGKCAVGSCDTGFFDCNLDPSDGCEVNTGADPNNCGSCGNVCTSTTGSPVCNSGQCGTSICGAGLGDCDGQSSNGCETDLLTSLNNCGFCTNVCSLPNATPACQAGACAITSCASGFADCDLKPADGCEVNLATSATNCGACGNICVNPNGSTACSAGVCKPSCNAGFADCDGNPANGCETSVGSDAQNCGACGKICDSTQGTASCTGGVCGIACSAGYGNCDNNASNGCETNLGTDSAHCGSCATACTNPNGTTACTAGVCKPTCNAGYADCDANGANGCETNLNTSVNHCGSCTNVCSCPTTPNCVNGTCGCTTCAAGTADCDGQASNGCETNLNTSLQNCGSCGNACTNAHGTTACSTGACTYTCSAGWGNCDGNASNGCETSLTTLTNCGTCGTACSLANATATCSTGTCAISTCNAGYMNCDGLVSTGCETNVQTDVNNCGLCGKKCNTGQTCTAGVCQGQVCGNGVIEGTEQCDDGNTKNLDGCDSTCHYEVVQRVNVLQIKNTTPAPSFCSVTTNQLGKALTSNAVSSFNSTLKTDIDAGTLNTLLQFLSLDDLKGVNDSSLQVGVMNGTTDPKKGTFIPTALDWWFLVQSTDVDASGLPLQKLNPAAIANRVLSGGPSTITINYSGNPLKMLSGKLLATIGSATSVPAPPPNQLAAGLTVFETIAANTTGQGLCGNITVGSLAKIPAPQSISVGGANACRSSCSNSLTYTYCGAGNPVGPSCNSLLDVLVGGCKATILCVTAINKEQPDVCAGGPGTCAPLSNDPTTHKVTVTQTEDAYSSYFGFTSLRGHITNNLP